MPAKAKILSPEIMATALALINEAGAFRLGGDIDQAVAEGIEVLAGIMARSQKSP